ncbi:MAG: hypothetical protein ACKOX2_11085, partial [Microcystaceae cyanobacterium]
MSLLRQSVKLHGRINNNSKTAIATFPENFHQEIQRCPQIFMGITPMFKKLGLLLASLLLLVSSFF